MTLRIWSILTVILLATPFTSFEAKSGPKQAEQMGPVERYRLGAGDQVRVTVFGNEDLSGNFTVDGSGFVALPLVGNVEASGISLEEFKYNVISALRPDYLKNPNVSVEVSRYRPFYIIGEVKRPGSYSFVHGMTVINAVALAGGYTRRAREDKPVIIRGSERAKIKQYVEPDTVVLPGDVIEIPERFF